MEFDLSMLIKIVAYVVAIVAVVLGLRYRTDALEKGKVATVDCLTKHGADNVRHAELRADMRVLRGGIRTIHENLRGLEAIDNPPKLPPEFYEDEGR